jgi:hypothetical protein
MPKTLLLATLLLGLLVTSVAYADLGPPKGLRRVPLVHKITTEHEFPDHVFFLVSGRDKVEPVKLAPKTPLEISGVGRVGPFRFTELVAVPKDAAKKYGSDKDFHAAIAAGKVDGLVKSKTGFSAETTIKNTDTRRLVVEEYRLEKIDTKNGIIITRIKGEPEPAPDGPTGAEAGATVYTPRGGLWIAGVVASLAVAFTGLWLVRRNR